MNENDRHEAFEATVQGELYREVVDIYAEPENFPREESSPFAERILQLIDKAVSARDAEIREALESEGVVNMFARMMWVQDDKPGAGPSSSYKMAARYNIDALTKAIGLAEEGAER